ncbi:MAG: PLP-dependent aminotransferase family protein [Rhodanobacter sp.]
MFVELDGHGAIYAQLTRAMKAAILDGRLASGTRLPPTRVLAQELGLSRITVVAAYEQLRTEGYIQSRAGSGSFVSVLQTEPALRPATTEPLAAATRYSRRARLEQNRSIARMHHGRRFDLQYGTPMINPAISAVWGHELARAAAYTPLEAARSQGSPALREQVCRYLVRSRGVHAHPDDVLIVNGFQQAVSLTARVLVEEGAAVVMEDPHYFRAWQALAAHGARMHSVRTDGEGLICAELPSDAPALVMVTPSHQFPAGSILSLPRRLELLRYAEAKQCWILEDDYDSEFRYDSLPLAALRSLDHGDRVIYVGTFSKVMFPSMRLGYMVLPAALRDDFINAKYLCDYSSSAIEQAALAHFMDNGGFERHLRRTMKALRARRKALLDGFHDHIGERGQIVDSHTGMHMIVWLRDYDHAQANALISHARGQGLGLYPIEPHYEEKPDIPGLLVGYCGLSPAGLRSAMQLFGECLDAIDAMAQRDRTRTKPSRRASEPAARPKLLQRLPASCSD